MTTETLNIITLLAATVLSTVAAITDTRTGQIPNWLTLPPLVALPLLNALCSPSLALDSVLSAALCGFVPLVSFRLGAMGGGDVKLCAELGASVGIQHGLEIQCVSVALAAMYGLALLAFRGQLLSALGGIVLRPVLLLVCPQRLPARRAVAPLSLRLGVPILVATVLVLAAHGSVPDHIL